MKNTKNILPVYVNWEVINQCNMGCPYCFLAEHPEGALPMLSNEDAKRMIRRVSKNGVKLLNYAGGEPLLREDLIELIEYGHSLGLKTILSTNGILLDEKKIEKLESFLDFVALPLDGHDSKTHDSVREMRGHFKKITSSLRKLEETDINLKINTMLCKKNISYAKDIAGFLDNFNVRKWKLFQFSARGKAKNIKDQYYISDEEFRESEKIIGEHSFDIVYSSNELRDNAYFLIQSDGRVVVPSGNDYIPLGNILEDELSKFNRPNILSREKNFINARVSYDLGV